ncbi:MAG: Omp28-related outer membrane protein, partial [Ignavibacteriae bacterium]|nr:Omp28-related outer membrane protein [Ignavibacteriota bacterium]
MKKVIFTVLVFVFFVCGMFTQKAISLDTTNVVMETCTGTWCGYCPCGHDIIRSILTSYPNTVVLCYHGPPNYGSPQDPWTAAGYPMIQLFGMSSYPTGVIGRTSGIISRSAWYATVASYSTQTPTVRVIITSPTINNTTRKVTGTISATALQNLTGAYSVFVAITENNLIYPQSIYAACGTAGTQNDYIHGHVV